MKILKIIGLIISILAGVCAVLGFGLTWLGFKPPLNTTPVLQYVYHVLYTPIEVYKVCFLILVLCIGWWIVTGRAKNGTAPEKKRESKLVTEEEAFLLHTLADRDQMRLSRFELQNIMTDKFKYTKAQFNIVMSDMKQRGLIDTQFLRGRVYSPDANAVTITSVGLRELKRSEFKI